MPSTAPRPSPAPLPVGARGIRRFTIGSRWLYGGDSRFDASSYAAGAIQALEAIEACPHEKRPLSTLVGTLWHPVQDQARSNFKRIYTSREHGVPFVGSREMFSLPVRPARFLSERMPKLGDLLIPEGWVLISRSGTIGNVLYVSERLHGCAITEDAIRIAPTQIESGYLYAFLASSYGRLLLERGTYGSTVDHLEPRHIATIPVPLPPESLRKSIADKALGAYALRDEANALLNRADELLHAELQLPQFDERLVKYLGDSRDPRAFIVGASELTGRLDASFHLPLARTAVEMLRGSKYPPARLGDLVERVLIPPRFKRIYVEEAYGIPFLQGSHVPLMRPYDLRSDLARASGLWHRFRDAGGRAAVDLWGARVLETR